MRSLFSLSFSQLRSFQTLKLQINNSLKKIGFAETDYILTSSWIQEAERWINDTL